jgi:hypothetical protein
VSALSLFACRDARGPQWQLGPLPPAQRTMTLIGWHQSPPPPDAGVPQPVARALAGAFTAVARATFLSSHAHPSASGAWSDCGGDQVRVLTRKGVASRIAARLRGTPQNITLVSTRRADAAAQLFGDEGFPWWMQGQIVLLSQLDAPPPGIDEPQLLALFADDWTARADALAAERVEAMVRPGVDGDVAGLLAFSESFEREVLAALEREARSLGATWASVPEEVFAVKLESG